MLRIIGLKKYFGGVKAVDRCSFNIEKGIITAIIGPNGSGKTTIFNLISGILRADCGKIIFETKNITNLSIEEISSLGISRLFQQTRLFNNLTVKENIFLAINNDDTKFWKNVLGINKIRKEDDDAINRWLGLFKLGKLKDKQCSSLSYGQKRLIELIRTIARPNKLLILDEPVAGVSPSIRKEMAKILLRLKNEGRTILLTEHDISFVSKLADKIIVMDNGKIVTIGKPSQIVRNKTVLKVYLGV